MPAPSAPTESQFHRGYYSGSGYTYGAFPEYFPLRLHLISLLVGHRPPPLDQPFRLLEFGCGQGVGLCLMAALHPQASFHGIDLLPSHISHARGLAAAAGLHNVVFQEADLFQLAEAACPGFSDASAQHDTPQPSAAEDSTPPINFAPINVGANNDAPVGSAPNNDAPNNAAPNNSASSDSAPSAWASSDAAAADGDDLTGTNAPGGPFDFAVCHGVLSWVGREVQQAVWQLASSWLRPGGLFALSYNAYPGKLSQLPFQHLVRSLQQSNAAGPDSLAAAIGLGQRLQQSGAVVFAAQPGLAELLQSLPNEDPDYLPHEYNQQRWQPRFSDAVIRQAGTHGFSFLASATLPDAFEGLLPESFRDVIKEQSDPALRQLLRDLLVNESFRRDVFVRGLERLWPQEAQIAIEELRVLRLIDAQELAEADARSLFTFQLSYGTVQGNPQWFGAFLHALGTEPRSIAELHASDGVSGVPLAELLQNLALLLQTGKVALLGPPVDPSPSQRLNRHLARQVRYGAPYRALAAPLIGSSFAIGDLDLICLDAHLEGHRGAALADTVAGVMLSLGRSVLAQGSPLNGTALQVFLREHARHFEQRTLPLLQRLGAVA